MLPWSLCGIKKNFQRKLHTLHTLMRTGTFPDQTSQPSWPLAVAILMRVDLLQGHKTQTNANYKSPLPERIVPLLNS